MEYGFTLSAEEHAPLELVRLARRAEEEEFTFCLISDHFHPWVDAQGESPFVWSVIGGIATATDRIRVGTGVTCPLIRIHPAIVAQAAATSAAMLPGRFFLGLGTGERLNEHILGDRWPAPDERVEMLEEAIGVIRELWEGGYVTRRGGHYTVDHARLYTLPEEPPPVAVAAGAQRVAELAGKLGDALINVVPDEEVVAQYREAGGSGPRYAQLHVCHAASEDEATRTAHEIWPISGLKGPLNQELATPADFEGAAAVVEPDDLRGTMPLGPDPEPYLEQVHAYEDAGYDHIYFHQVGPDQEGFLRFWREELKSKLTRG